MRTQHLSFLIFLLLGFSELPAQDLFPCGTVGGRSEWLRRYQANPDGFVKNLDTVLYVPLTVHIVGNDDGAGYLSVGRVLESLCRLNLDFEESNLQFFIEGEIRYYDNLAWYAHATVIEGAYMMLENNVENTINCYFVSDPAGNAGYNLPYAGIAIAKSAATADSHTWAHEIGHALSVQHPFLGWEGGISYDGSTPPDFGQPAPLTVTYDYTNFKDTLLLDTLIIDTALVELVDGSNCHLAADGFCDTSPDYLAQGWLCNGNGQSTIEQTDPNGEVFRSDGSLIMNYSIDDCQARFSPEQIGAMRANLYDEKPELLYNQTPEPPVALEPVELLFPLPGETVDPFSPYLEWGPVENATQYLVQVSLLSNFNPFLTQEIVVADLSAFALELLPERTYYWRVRPFNSHSFCAPFSGIQSFETGNATSVDGPGNTDPVTVYPNPVEAGGSLFLRGAASEGFYLYDGTGRRLAPALNATPSASGEVQLRLPSSLPAGFYLLSWEGGMIRLVVY